MVYHMPNCIVLFSKSSFLFKSSINYSKFTTTRSTPHSFNISLILFQTSKSTPNNELYLPIIRRCSGYKNACFRKTSGIPAPASARCGFLWCTLRTVDSTARYWSDKREDAYCFFLPGTSRYRYCRSSPIHTARSGILLSNIYGKMPRGRCFLK